MEKYLENLGKDLNNEELESMKEDVENTVEETAMTVSGFGAMAQNQKLKTNIYKYTRPKENI